MKDNHRNLPALKALMAFEAAVRLGSMTAAAKETGTTQPAISQQIRSLEDTVGGALLDRSGNRLRPTPTGKRFHEELSPVLTHLHAALERARVGLTQQVPLITIAANFGFSHLWLLPRLHVLQSAFPDVRFQVLPVDTLDAALLHEADLSISFDQRNSGREGEIMLAPECVFPVCSPGFAQLHALGNEVTERDLRAVALLHMDERNPRWLDWARWSDLAGFGKLNEQTSFTFNNYPLLLNAAIQGHGLVLAWGALAEQAIQDGLLLPLGPTVTRQDHGYLLRTRHRNNALIAPIVEWFKSTMNSTQA
ncbi:LysR family transcriptional regulator [Pseudomonas sp. NPDC088444]|uniref:LysR family transcriptional regulator n=1 Tax=Pseudomonas sp. NPDC088444 TaxID=3364456 RepID=UPI00384EFB51